MNRSLKLAVCVALAVASAPALALELGQIQVKSALDRPLVADIPLRPDYPGELDHLKVTLAPAAAFARAGINRAALKVPLTFKIVTEANGQKAIQITSTQPVREPYLDFLVQVTWPKGKLLREYVVLLNPLSMTSAPVAAPVKPAVATRPAPVKSPPAALPPPPIEPAAGQTSATQGQVYGPVQHGDTLSHIALADAIHGVSYQQMLVALKATNPDAFFRNNVNALKAGAILRIPTRAQALAVTRKAAIAAVRQQNQAWQGQPHAAKPTMVAGTGGSSAALAGAGKAPANDDHLHLVPPSAGRASAGAAGGSRQATVSELRQDLARSKEALSSQKQSAVDLTSRVSALEQIGDKNKRLLGLKNAEIAELQQKLASVRQAAHLPALPMPAKVAVAPNTAGAVAAAAGVASMALAHVASTATALPAVAASAGKTSGLANATSVSAGAHAITTAAAQTKAAVVKKAPAKPVPSVARHTVQASAPWYEQLWARAVLIIVIVLLIILALLQRRKKPGDKKAQPAKTPKPGKAAKEAKASVADHFGDSPFGHEADAEAVDADTAVGAVHVDNDGEDELLAQLASHPDNIGLHLELASLYFARGDASQFEGAAEAMHAYVDDENDPEWQEVVAMGHELVPDHPLFAHVEHAAKPFAASAGAALPEFNDHVWHDDQTHALAPADAATGLSASHYEHDDFGMDLAPPAAAHAEPVAESRPVTTGLPDESEFDALPPLSMDEPESEHRPLRDESAQLESGPDLMGGLTTHRSSSDFDDEGGFSDDPVDTKLDLARAYMDMGDHVGARAMLTEALHEGSHTQQETARKLLDELKG